MATIYRFVVEETSNAKSGGRNSGSNSKTTTAKSKTMLQLFATGEKGGVEHNRKLRAINPLLNKATSGYWEKGMRLGRAGLGLLKFNATTGAFVGLSAAAIAIILSFIIQETIKWHKKEMAIADNYNKANFKGLETGQSSIRGSYEVSVNQWSGRVSYNQNK